MTRPSPDHSAAELRAQAEALSIKSREKRAALDELTARSRNPQGGPVAIDADIELKNIIHGARMRTLRSDALETMKESMRRHGLLQPIVVRPEIGVHPESGARVFCLLAGLHRFKAAEELGWNTIPCRVIFVRDENEALLAEIDENLARTDLTTAERSIHQARRKVIYQELHPETKVGANQHTAKSLGQDGQGSELAPRFDEAAAEATGQSSRSIRRDVHRAEELGEATLAKIARTSLDSGAEMDALIKLPDDKRADLVKRAAKGQQVSAQAEIQKLVAAGIDAAKMPSGGLAIAHRRVEPVDSLEYFPTPPFATRALFEHSLKHLNRLGHCRLQKAREPGCGKGLMAEVMREYFREVLPSDIGDYDYKYEKADFLDPTFGKAEAVDWIITNPPFKRSTEFVLKALELAGTGVAMFVRLTWLESSGRYEEIFSKTPPSLISFFAERVPLHKGRWEPDGTTMSAYVWLTWIKGMPPQPAFWIPPGCRAALTKPDDRKRFGVVDFPSEDAGDAGEVVDIPAFLRSAS